MKQPGRREFLRLMAAAASGSALEVLLKKVAAQPLASGQNRNFQTPNKPLRIGLISDLNSSYGSTSYGPTVERGVNLLLQQKPDLVICAGDMVAGQKTSLTDRQLAAMWEGFETFVRRPLETAGIPLLPAMGNHDASSQQSQGRWIYARERQQASRFWSKHQDAVPSGLTEADIFPFQYAWHGPGLFLVVMDASSSTVSSAQRQWLTRTLNAPQRQQDDLCLVVGHLPLTAFSQGRARAGECIHDAASLAAELRQADVDLVISGHHHAWYPAEALGLRLLSLGAMGSGPRRLLGSSSASPASLTLLDWSAADQSISERTLNLNSFSEMQTDQLPTTIVAPGFAETRRRHTQWQRPQRG
ncbi:metallophosphoesterase family protein [Synechococcus sp. WH 7805]|uniref:metallophosphoesterase family protein n=2 Tax=Synechococcus TaxID=1129 RepID=UPI0003211846|nr:metallophosphoesterase [Synechococcus sp. WH 7805]